MRDVQTGSLWSQILGVAVQGPLQGTALQVVPSTLTTWSDWKSQWPATTVLALPRTAHAFTPGFYRRPERFCIGLLWAGSARAWPLNVLLKRPVLQDTVAGEPVLVLFEKKTGRFSVLSRRVEDLICSFTVQSDNMLRDRETKSTWSRRTGQAVAGPLRGKVLKPLPALYSYRRAWEVFHPEGTFYEGEASESDPRYRKVARSKHREE